MKLCYNRQVDLSKHRQICTKKDHKLWMTFVRKGCFCEHPGSSCQSLPPNCCYCYLLGKCECTFGLFWNSYNVYLQFFLRGQSLVNAKGAQAKNHDYGPIASNSLKMIRVTFSKPDGIFRRMFLGAHSLRDRWVECIILVAFDQQYGFWAHYKFLGQIFCWFVFLTTFSKCDSENVFIVCPLQWYWSNSLLSVLCLQKVFCYSGDGCGKE